MLSFENAISLMQKSAHDCSKNAGRSEKSRAPSSLATVYWNTQSKDVYLLVNKLPAPVPDKQYQLWAIVDGKPVDAGVFEMAEGISFVKLKTIPKAEAFAITLEKKGGSTKPDMDAMYVMGKVTI
ncbi:MAG: anti-sigma factor [Puia sp.]